MGLAGAGAGRLLQPPERATPEAKPRLPGPGRPCSGNTVCERDGALEHGGREDGGRRSLLPLGQAGADHDGGAAAAPAAGPTVCGPTGRAVPGGDFSLDGAPARRSGRGAHFSARSAFSPGRVTSCRDPGGPAIPRLGAVSHVRRSSRWARPNIWSMSWICATLAAPAMALGPSRFRLPWSGSLDWHT